MSVIHILRVPTTALPWWRTDERSPILVGRKVWTDCCCCRQPAGETESRYHATYVPPIGGSGWYQDPMLPEEVEPDPPTGAYYDGHWETRCGEGFGCTVKPRMRCGQTLRRMMREPL